MFDEPEPSEQFDSSTSAISKFEAALVHRQRLLDIGLPAVINKNAAGEETVYVVLPIEGDFYIDKISSVDFFHPLNPASQDLNLRKG